MLSVLPQPLVTNEICFVGGTLDVDIDVFYHSKPPLMYVEFHLLGTGQLRPNEMSLYRHNDDMDVDFRGWLT